MQPRKTIVVQLGHDALAMTLWRRVHARRDDLEVQLTRDVDALLQRVDAVRPAVTVLELPDLSPPRRALLRELRSRDPAPRIVAVVREGCTLDDDALLVEGVDAIVRAPIDVAAMIDTVETVAQADETMRGQLAAIGLLDVVQMLCLARRDGVVRLAAREGHGAIWIEHGEIVHATWDGHAAMDALVQLTALDEGTFRVHAAGVVPQRSIVESWRHALMNAACLADERRANVPTAEQEQPAAEMAPVAELPARAWQVRYRELTELGLAAMRGGDLASARTHWNEARRLQEANGDEDAAELEPGPASGRAGLVAPRVRGYPASA